MAKKNLKRVVQRGKTSEIKNYCSKQDGVTVSEGSSHTKIKTSRGATFLGRGREIKANGTKFALIKQLAAIGITILIIMIKVQSNY